MDLSEHHGYVKWEDRFVFMDFFSTLMVLRLIKDFNRAETTWHPIYQRPVQVRLDVWT